MRPRCLHWEETGAHPLRRLFLFGDFSTLLRGGGGSCAEAILRVSPSNCLSLSAPKLRKLKVQQFVQNATDAFCDKYWLHLLPGFPEATARVARLTIGPSTPRFGASLLVAIG